MLQYWWIDLWINCVTVAVNNKENSKINGIPRLALNFVRLHSNNNNHRYAIAMFNLLHNPMTASLLRWLLVTNKRSLGIVFFAFTFIQFRRMLNYVIRFSFHFISFHLLLRLRFHGICLWKLINIPFRFVSCCDSLAQDQITFWVFFLL